MNTSEQINELAAALSKAQGEMRGAVKDSQNPFFRSTYADLASVWDACREPLTKNGLAVLQFPQTTFTGEPETYKWTAKGSGEERSGVRIATTVTVLTRLTHSGGQWVEDSVSAMLPSGDPQAVGSAISYLRRYSLQSVVGVAPEDDDGNAASTPTPAPAPRQRTQAPANVPPKVTLPSTEKSPSPPESVLDAHFGPKAPETQAPSAEHARAFGPAAGEIAPVIARLDWSVKETQEWLRSEGRRSPNDWLPALLAEEARLKAAFPKRNGATLTMAEALGQMERAESLAVLQRLAGETGATTDDELAQVSAVYSTRKAELER